MWGRGGAAARLGVCAEGVRAGGSARVSRGGCRRGSFVEGSCRFKSQLGTSPFLLPQGHLALVHSPYISVPAAPISLGGQPSGPAPAFGCSEQRVGWRLPNLQPPPRPRAGVGEGRRASRGAVGGRKGPSRKGRAGLAAGAGISLLALLPEAAAAPRPAPPCPLAVRGCRGCSDLGTGDGAGSERREQGPRVSVSRAAEADTIAAQGHQEPATPRLGRSRGGNQPGPGAGAPSLGCFRVSLGRLRRFELPPHPTG